MEQVAAYHRLFLKQYSEGKKLQKEKEDLQKQIENTTRMRATVYKTMCKDFNASMSPFFSISLIKRALEVLSRHDYSGKDIPFIRDKTIEYLLKQKVCQSNHLTKSTKCF